MLLEILLTLMDKPLVIQNSGIFIFGVACYAVALALMVAVGLVWLRDEIEELVEIETLEEITSEEVQLQTRFNDIVERVKQSLGPQNSLGVAGI